MVGRYVYEMFWQTFFSLIFFILWTSLQQRNYAKKYLMTCPHCSMLTYLIMLLLKIGFGDLFCLYSSRSKNSIVFLLLSLLSLQSAIYILLDQLHIDLELLFYDVAIMIFLNLFTCLVLHNSSLFLQTFFLLIYIKIWFIFHSFKTLLLFFCRHFFLLIYLKIWSHFSFIQNPASCCCLEKRLGRHFFGIDHNYWNLMQAKKFQFKYPPTII